MFADKDLADRLAANGGFDSILDITHVDAEAVGGGAIDNQIHVRLPSHLERAQVGDAWNFCSSRPGSRRLWPPEFLSRCQKA